MEKDSGEILRGAAYRISQGWIQRYFSDSFDFFNSNSYCLTGAIFREREEDPLLRDTPEIELVAKSLNLEKVYVKLLRAANYQAALARWNNEPERTQDEVVQALLDAAKLYESTKEEVFA